jgi:hypothetical protein
MTSTIKFATFPFTHKGIKFVSRVSEQSKYLVQILAMGDEFITMNKEAIDELLTITENTTRAELVAMVDHINEGGTLMFLELGEQN